MEQFQTNQLTQITSCLPASCQRTPFGRTAEAGRLIYHIQDNISIANTSESIATTLHTVLQRGTASKHLSPILKEKSISQFSDGDLAKRCQIPTN
ncbi:hypothetical protein KSF_103440 [Reticulibacter mediterranei]|uniref:Uncharacterized protein n=2 Tax=Reticulibacter mediterranei TaxID=2778369 RepID=A0A8J3J3Y1_9CHLR|nr:hypothetical protein KSF_103440 [Reticulibacter mediterranei]